MTQPMLSDEQIEEIVYIVLNHGQVDDAVAEIHEYLATLAPPAAPAGDREAAADDVGALIVPETGVPLAEWPEVKALGDRAAVTPPAQPAEERAVIDALWSCVEKATLPDSGHCSQDHLFSMLSRMRTFEKAGKFNRWLGYIQGVLVATGNGTVEQFKDMNRSPAALSRARTGSEVKS